MKNLGTMKKSKNESLALKGGKKEVLLDYSELRKGVLVLRSVNHKLRQAIIDLLEEQDQMSVTDLFIRLRLEQSVASQHLAILRKSGVVDTVRNGKFIFYSLNRDRLRQIAQMVDDILR